MHILFFSHYFPPEVNAPATRTFEHCKRWVKADHQVTVITCAPNCPDGKVYSGYHNRLYQTEIVEGIKVIRVWTFIAANKGFLLRIFNYVSYMKMAVLFGLFQRQVDVIVATSPQFFCGWAGVLLHWFRRWPFVLEIRDIWPESIVTVGAMKKSPLIRVLEFLEKLMYRSANHIVAVGNGYKHKIVEKGTSEEKVSVVINGVDPEQFKKVDAVDQVRKRYNAEGKFVCSYIGTVGMAHGLEVVLRAAEEAQASGDKDLLFWIIGEGAQKKPLEEFSNRQGLENIVFTGRLPRASMPEMISASDACLVHLRGTELFQTVIPSKIFEFMAMNTPIIMGVRGEALDIVLQAGAGVEMKPDSAASLLKCIRTIRERCGDKFRGRDHVSRHFNRDNLADSMLGLLKKSTLK